MIVREEGCVVFGVPILKNMRLFLVCGHHPSVIFEADSYGFIGSILSVWEQEQVQDELIALALLSVRIFGH